MRHLHTHRAARILAATAITAALILPSFAAASLGSDILGQFQGAGAGAGVGSQEAKVEFVVARIINATLSVIGIVLVALLVYAGWLWMTAAGEEDQITKAKAIIRGAIIGLMLVLLSYAISRFVISRLLTATSNVR